MQLMRVATFAATDQMISAAMRTQATMANEQQQEASGLVSSDYGGLGADARQVLDLQVSIARSKSYSDAATAAADLATTMSAALTSMTSILTSLRSDLTAATSTDTSASSVTSLKTTAAGLLQELAAQLNTQYEGQYVFGGSDTGTAPVNISNPPYAAATASSSADISYYQGDTSVASVRVSGEQVVQYGITANNTAFEQALRALNMVANASGSTIDSTTLSTASGLAQSALDAITAVQSKLSSDSSAMQRAISDQTTYQTDLTSVAGNLTSVDVAAVTAKLTNYQTQLEASYAALAKIDGLNLVSYLK
jgi:flagellar hook-associated protein 3 FlgL